jgi:predicted hydrocarbon binding protein
MVSRRQQGKRKKTRKIRGRIAHVRSHKSHTRVKRSKTAVNNHRVRASVMPFQAEAAAANASYEEALISGIIQQKYSSVTYEPAALLVRLLLSLTKSMRTLSYKSGITTGKELYRITSSGKRYYWYEESIPDLISFLERSLGVPVSYSFLHNGIRIRSYGRNPVYLGANMHTFEAGIIAGFITAASHQAVNISEQVCSNNNSDYCEFVPSVHGYDESEIEMEKAVSRFAEHVSMMVKTPSTTSAQQKPIPCSYHALLVRPLLNSEYLEAVDNISAYIGSKVAQHLFDDKKPRPSKILDYLSKSAILLNFGAPTIKPSHDHAILNMDFVFSPEASKKEYVELSLAFINGLMSKASRPDVSFEMKSKGSSYLLRMKEKA